MKSKKIKTIVITALTGCMLLAIFIPLIVFMAVADLFSADQENGTIKAVITRLISRNEILISKMISILLYITCILTVTFIISSIIDILFGRTQVIDIPVNFLL